MSNSLSRRSVLRTVGATGVGYWLGATSAVCAAGSANQRLNIACIGVGGRGRANLDGVADQNIVALCDVDATRAAGSFERFPKARRFQDYRKMFDKMHQQIDAVVVSTPDHTHFHPSMLSMQLGKHLYCEKPMAHSVWEIRQMTEMARKQGVATQLGVQRHTLANVHRSVELIQHGAIGTVSEVHCWIDGDRGMRPGPMGKETAPKDLDWDLWLGPAAYRDFSKSYCPYEWRFWWEFGTGETGNWGCHTLDIPYWALGLRYPVRVTADGPPVDPQRSPKSMFTHIVFDDPAVTLHWSHCKDGPPILKQNGLSGHGMNTLFIGSEGMLLTGFGSHRLYPEEKFRGFSRPAASIPDSPGFHREWLNACQGGSPATCHFDYSGPLSETVLLGNTAYRGGGFDWDAGTLSTTGNARAQQLIRTEFRAGWQI